MLSYTKKSTTCASSAITDNLRGDGVNFGEIIDFCA